MAVVRDTEIWILPRRLVCLLVNLTDDQGWSDNAWNANALNQI